MNFDSHSCSVYKSRILMFVLNYGIIIRINRLENFLLVSLLRIILEDERKLVTVKIQFAEIQW